MSEHARHRSWPKEPDGRWVRAGHAFGRHLMQFSRDYALDLIPKGASASERAIAEQAASNAIYGFLMMLDGVSVGKVDEDLWLRLRLTASVDGSGGDEPLEQFELAPEGDGLCVAFHGWVEGDFGSGSGE